MCSCGKLSKKDQQVKCWNSWGKMWCARYHFIWCISICTTQKSCTLYFGWDFLTENLKEKYNINAGTTVDHEHSLLEKTFSSTLLPKTNFLCVSFCCHEEIMLMLIFFLCELHLYWLTVSSSHHLRSYEVQKP